APFRVRCRAPRPAARRADMRRSPRQRRPTRTPRVLVRARLLANLPTLRPDRTQRGKPMTDKPPPRWDLLRVEPSGATGRLWALPLVGLASAAVSAFVYAWVNVYSPIAGYVSLLFVAMLAAGAALPVAFAARWAKCRNLLAVRCVGAATGLAAVYLAWAFFAWVLLWHSGANADVLPSMWDFVCTPRALWNFAVALDKEGWYSFGHGPGMRPSGVV